MADILSTFPFFELPGKALSNVVRCMDLPEFLCLSLISYKSQQLVKSLNIDSQISSIHVTDEVVITLYDFHHFYFVWDYDYPENLEVVEKIPDENGFEGFRNEGLMILTEEGFNLGHWMSHLQSILIEPEIQVVSLYSIPAPVDAQWFFNSITGSGIKYLAIHESFSVKECRPLLPFVKELDMYNGPSKDILIQNFDCLTIQRTQLSLDEYLIMNSSHIITESWNVSEKLLNRFFKHWMRGSNPRLRYIKFNAPYQHRLNVEKILNGINHQALPETHVQIFNLDLICSERTEVRGGYNFYRNDGTRATLTIRPYCRTGFIVSLYVWH
ncbi:hypothetical protein CRE_29341 [Caenorhabditis remanei]|uniref:F-box domain-containing protein n=1 Tax=Caenorhabditis remanei TaxID=31234 RepID=E3MXZ8_CAERE|nr:hypothetical protein CRE_29341 [Caenorhabditis remanei]